MPQKAGLIYGKGAQHHIPQSHSHGISYLYLVLPTLWDLNLFKADVLLAMESQSFHHPA